VNKRPCALLLKRAPAPARVLVDYRSHEAFARDDTRRICSAGRIIAYKPGLCTFVNISPLLYIEKKYLTLLAWALASLTGDEVKSVET
jgi:hypothetical protein